MILYEGTGKYSPWWTFVLAINDMVCVAFPILSIGLVGFRYYSHFFTDNGYMTFTLPVKRGTLYLSKFLNAMIWDLSATVVSVVASGITLLFLPEDNTVWSVSLTSFNIFENVFWAMAEDDVLYSVVFLLSMTIGKYAIIYLGLTIGAIFVRKAKVIVSLVLIYAFFIATVVTGLIVLLLLGFWSSAAGSLFPNSNLGIWDLMNFISILILTGASLLHCINLHLLEKKLNLS